MEEGKRAPEKENKRQGLLQVITAFWRRLDSTRAHLLGISA